MALTTTTNRVVFSGNGTTTVWPYTFPIPDATYLSVIYTDADGLDTTLNTALYSVTGIGTTTGGNVTYPLVGSPIAASTALTLVRTVPYTQTTVFSNQGGYYPEVLEARLDLMTMESQQLADLFTRSLVAPASDAEIIAELPTSTQRINGGAGSLLGFSGVDGNPYAATVGSGSFSVNTWVSTNFFPVASALAARTLFAVYSTTETDAAYTAKATLTTKGDTYAATAASTPARLAVGADGSILMARSAATPGVAYVSPFNSIIYGLTYANNATDAVNDLDIAAGGCMDATGAYWITLAALTKQSDVAWAVGTNAGGLDTGAVGNSDYYIWAIARSGTGVTDALFSLSSTAPTMPASYDFKRLIGWFKRTGGTIVAFKTYETEGGGLQLAWNTPTLDINLSNTLTTARRTDAVKVPLNISTIAHLRVLIVDVSAGFSAIVCCPDETDVAPSAAGSYGVAPLSNFNAANANDAPSADIWVRTSAAGLVAARATLATVDLYTAVTLGFRWARR